MPRLQLSEISKKHWKNHGFSWFSKGRPYQTNIEKYNNISKNMRKNEASRTNLFWGSPNSILEASGPILGASWAPLGPLLGALGRLLAPLGRSLGASWALLGRSWAFLGRSGMDLGRFLAPGSAPGLDFRGFGDVSGWVLEALRAMIQHAFCSTCD